VLDQIVAPEHAHVGLRVADVDSDQHGAGSFHPGMPARVDYDEHQHRVFSRARAVLPENRRLWGAIFRNWMSGAELVVDVGAGVGHYSTVLADALEEAQVIAVEPAQRMRAVAEAEHAHPRVRYVAGAAEELPLDDGSVDAALLSNVIHHLDDRAAAAAELHRVLRPGGTVVLRGSLRDALRRNPNWRFFPEALAIAEDQMPTVSEAIALFTDAGFEHVASDVIEQPTAPDLQAFAERIALRAISSLELLDDEVFERGLAALRAAAAAETEPAPVMELMDLVVLRRSTA
jgi:ubiquinone/menaquinone biosynthesis C-methylase UbiE